MATNTEVNVRINVDAKGADSSVGSIKKQLKDATNELVAMREKFGDSSAEAVTAAKKVAELKDAIGDAKAMTDAFDPDAKFKAFGATLQGVAGGFAAVQGAQALFGSESEAVSRTLAKVQGAMALSQGINSVLQAKDAFKNLGAVLSNNVLIQKALNFVMTGSLKSQQQLIVAKEMDVAATATQTTVTEGLTLAQKAAKIAAIAMRGALLATGVGALLVLLGSLMSSISDWISGEKESAEAIEASNKALETQQENYKKVSDEIKFATEVKIKQAEIEAKSQADIFKIKQEGNKKEQEAAKKNYNDLVKQANDFYNNVGELRDDGNRYYTEKELEQKHKIEEARKSAYNNLLQLQRDYTNNSLDEQKRLADLSRAADGELLNLKQANYLASIKDDDTRNREKSKIDLENAKKSLHEKGYSLEQEAAITKELETKSNLEIQAIDDAAAAKAKQKREANYKEQKAKRDARAKEIADATKALNEKIASLENEVYLMSIENEEKRAKEKLRIQFEAGIREIEQSKANESLKLDAIIALQAKYDADVKAIDDKKKADDEEKALEQRQKSIDFENETFNMLEEARIARIQDATLKAQEEEAKRYQAEIDAALALLNKKEIDDIEYKSRREAIETVHQDKLTEITKTANEERKKQDEAAYQAKLAQWSEIGGLAQQLSGIIGETTAVGKGLALSQIAIDTGLAIASLTKNSEANPTNAATFGAAGAIQFASGLIRILANIKKAKDLLTQAKVPAKGGGNNNVNLPSGGGATIAPIAPTLNTTMLNQSQINQLSSATARAYVVESDVTGSQERIQRLNRAARIN